MRNLLFSLAFAVAGVSTAPVMADQAAPIVDIDNFTRAETDNYLRLRQEAGIFGEIVHNRAPIDIDNQPVVRGNRDTLYSYGVFDLSQPVTITLPQGDRFQSIRIVDQNHFIVMDVAEPGTYELTQEKVGTRYIHVNVRTLVNPDDPKDLEAAHVLQDQVTFEQADAGNLDLPDWDQASLDAVRTAILAMAPYVPDSRFMFGAKEEVDQVRHLIGTAGGWGGGPEYAVLFVNVFPEQNDGQTPYQLTVKDVPVDGFWSISIYNEAGYFEKNDTGGYSLNNLTAQQGEDGSYTINFGGDPAQSNWLNISEGWNYTIRMYLPRQEVIEGEWSFPEAKMRK